MVGQNVETRSCGILGTSNRKQWRETTLLHQPKIKEITTRSSITSHRPWNYNCNCSTTVSIRRSEHATFLSFDVSSYTPHCLHSLNQGRKKNIGRNGTWITGSGLILKFCFYFKARIFSAALTTPCRWQNHWTWQNHWAWRRPPAQSSPPCVLVVRSAVPHTFVCGRAGAAWAGLPADCLCTPAGPWGPNEPQPTPGSGGYIL